MKLIPKTQKRNLNLEIFNIQQEVIINLQIIFLLAVSTYKKNVLFLLPKVFSRVNKKNIIDGFISNISNGLY